MTTDFSNLTPGTSVTSLSIRTSPMQLFMYSAITWNRHHVHYSKDAAIAEGLPDVVVHRGLMGNFLTRMLEGWMGENGEIQTVNWKVISSATPSDELLCTGLVTEVSKESTGTLANLEVFINQDKRIVALGEATVRIF